MCNDVHLSYSGHLYEYFELKVDQTIKMSPLKMARVKR
jgi:hypothetical protein